MDEGLCVPGRIRTCGLSLRRRTLYPPELRELDAILTFFPLINPGCEIIRTMKTFYLSTLGCRLNQAESQKLEKNLVSRGWQKTTESSGASLIILNTCVVTEKAEKEVRQLIRRLRRENKKAKIVVAGCWVDLIKSNKDKFLEEVDLMITNDQKWEALLGSLGFSKEKKTYSNTRALIKIQSGCFNNCTYCLPRLVRGKSISVPTKEIIGEAKESINQGALQVILTGQNVAQYNDQGKNWVDLVERVLKETDIELIRLGSVNPTIVEEKGKPVDREERNMVLKKLVSLYKGVGKDRLSRHLHLSLQSGSDKILKLMNRKCTTRQFREVANYLKKNIKDINITTDIIVGFPQETKADFQKTLDFCKEIGFGKIHIFRYSKRKGTPATSLKDQINYQKKVERAKILSKLEKQLRLDFYKSQLGKEAMAIVWSNGRGLTDNYIQLSFKKPPKTAKVLTTKLVKLSGDRVESLIY